MKKIASMTILAGKWNFRSKLIENGIKGKCVFISFQAFKLKMVYT